MCHFSTDLMDNLNVGFLIVTLHFSEEEQK